MLSSDVKLARGFEPRFPQRCVRCGKDAPEDTFAVRSPVITWWSLASFLAPLFALFTNTERVEAPACTACAKAMGRVRTGRGALGWVLIAIVFALAFTFGVKKWVLVTGVLLAIVPEILLDVFVPQSFDTTVFREHVDYEFRDAEFAAEFAELNGGEVE